jgi:aromatic ring-opening dioxygenase LigB subunit
MYASFIIDKVILQNIFNNNYHMNSLIDNEMISMVKLKVFVSLLIYYRIFYKITK